MAKVMGRSKPRSEGAGASMKMSETGIFIVLGIIGLLALKYYFVDYKQSPGYVLGQYIGAIKAGNVEAQYALVDDKDKKTLTTARQYEKTCKWARGYTERIMGSNFAKPVPDAKDPDILNIMATVQMRGQAGKELTDNGAVVTVIDKYALHKDASGAWKVLLSESDLSNMLKQTANPPSDPW